MNSILVDGQILRNAESDSMNNQCPQCQKKMLETTGPSVRLTYPPQKETIMWCGCGYRESRGWFQEKTQDELRMEEWHKINSV